MRQIFDELVSFHIARQSSLVDAVRLTQEYMTGGEECYAEIKAKLPKSLHSLFDAAIAARIRNGYDLKSSIDFVSGLMPESEFESYESAIAEFEPAPAPTKATAKKAE